MASARFGRQRLDVPAELETVFEQAQIGDEGFWAGGFDLGDDGLQTFARDGAASGGGEILDGADGASLRDAGGASDAFEISAGARGGGESADGEKTFVVKNNVDEIFRFVARERAYGAEIHEERAVAIEDHDFLMGQAEREAESGRGSEAHGMLQIEKIGAMTDRLELGWQRAHDGDDQTFFKVGVNGAEAIDAQHHSSHIRSRVRSRATG